MKFNNYFCVSNIDRKKGISLPREMSSELAEIVGIHFGDGNMNKSPNFTYRLLITCNLREIQYAHQIVKLFKKTFNLTLNISERPRKNCIYLYAYSKTLCEFFHHQLKISYGSKNNLKIPNYVLDKDEFLRPFLRGIFDTDGCFTVQKDKGYHYKLIKICTKWKCFALDIKNGFKRLKIDSYICWKKTGYDVTIRRVRSYNRFISLIGSKKKE